MDVTTFARRLCAEPASFPAPEREVKRCVNCGSLFDRRLNRRRSFCSTRCRYAWHDLGKVAQRRLDFGR